MSGSLRSLIALLIITAISASAGATAAADPSKKPMPTQGTFFVVPSFAVDCYVSDRPSRLVCSSYNRRPTLSMRRKGKVRKGSVRGSPPPPVAPQILAEGEEWSDGSYTCLHRHTGLTCRNRSHHGWWIGRNARYRRF